MLQFERYNMRFEDYLTKASSEERSNYNRSCFDFMLKYWRAFERIGDDCTYKAVSGYLRKHHLADVANMLDSLWRGYCRRYGKTASV